MTYGLAGTSQLDVGGIGIDRQGLSAFDLSPIDLHGWFETSGTEKPLELEIGTGKGTFLIQQAKRFDHVNYIGLEYVRSFWRYAADRCRRHGLHHVRLVHMEAGSFLRCYVPNQCFHQVHIYFPDPWPKRRHHKRRLICEEFLRLLHTKLELGGAVQIATDHQAYFQWILESVARTKDLFDLKPFQVPRSAGVGELVGTNFERKYRLQGRSFHAMTLEVRQ